MTKLVRKRVFQVMAPIIASVLAASSSAAGARAQPERISAVIFDKAEVGTIISSPGLSTSIIFPCEINEAVPGRIEDVRVEVSPTTKKQLTLHFSHRMALPTNLTVRCGDEIDPLVFDLIPSRVTHQDVYRIFRTFGGPVEREIAREQKAQSALAKLEQKRQQKRRDQSDLDLKKMLRAKTEKDLRRVLEANR